MRLSVLIPTTLLALVCVSLAAPDDARADGYVGAGMGSDSQLSGDLASHFATSENTNSSRVLLGQRFGALALEASLFGSQLQGISGLTGNEDYSTLSLGVDVKYHLGLIGGLEGYGKIGLNKTWLTGSDSSEDLNYSGRGEALGVGLQYSFNLAVTQIGLWADYTLQNTDLRDDERQQALDGEIGMFNLGVSIGL
jgi:hypothetical protein